MENLHQKISVQDLAEEVARLIKGEIVATYTQENNALQVHFLNGQTFRIVIEEEK